MWCANNSVLKCSVGHLVEDFSSSPHLCGVCLRKLQFRRPFDPEQRYRRLLEIFRAGGMPEDCKWMRNRLRLLETAGDEAPIGGAEPQGGPAPQDRPQEGEGEGGSKRRRVQPLAPEEVIDLTLADSP